MRSAGLAVLFLLCGVATSPAQILYQTGFESPPFVDGNLLGQDGWQSTDDPATPGRGVVQGLFAHTGLKSFRFDASVVITSADWYWQELNHAVQTGDAPIIQINWHIFLSDDAVSKSAGWGIDVYDNSLPVSRRVTAVIVNAQDRLMVWNSNGFFDTGVDVSRGQWHSFRVNLNYASGARTTAVFLNGVRVANNLAFSPNTTNTVADVDLYNLDGGGEDHAFYDDLSIAALADGDGDGIPDDDDTCPNTAPGEPVDDFGCSTLDDDGDGVTNDFDECPNTPSCADPVLSNGCPVDTDGDGVVDGCDNCPNDPNPLVVYQLGDSFNDCALADGLVNDLGLWQPDFDCDGIGDVCDPCPTVKLGDANVDGVVNALDLQRFIELLTGDAPQGDELCACDINGDLDITLDDVPGFVGLLVGG